MSFEQSNVYVVRVTPPADSTRDEFVVGPYGSTRADQVADRLEKAVPGRQCTVLPLFSDDECLHVGDYSERGPHSLR